MCTRALILFFIGCVLLSSRNSALEMVDICKGDVQRESVLPSTEGAFKINLSYDESQVCRHTFNSSSGQTIFTFRLDSCNAQKLRVVIIVDGREELNVCDEMEQTSFQKPIYSVAYSYKLWVTFSLEARDPLQIVSHLPNMTVSYTSFKNEESFSQYICKECYESTDWAVESEVCNSSWYGNCSLSEPSQTTTPCITVEIQSKSELTSMFVSGFVVLIFVFVALHCGGGKTPPRPTNILTNGHSTMIQHPALSIGDGYRAGGGGGVGGRGFHPTKGGSMNFV